MLTLFKIKEAPLLWTRPEEMERIYVPSLLAQDGILIYELLGTLSLCIDVSCGIMLSYFWTVAQLLGDTVFHRKTGEEKFGFRVPKVMEIIFLLRSFQTQMADSPHSFFL